MSTSMTLVRFGTGKDFRTLRANILSHSTLIVFTPMSAARFVDPPDPNSRYNSALLNLSSSHDNESLSSHGFVG
ncbi:MAG: hypothetical protein ABJ239_00560 [Erythrobacter sp.]